MTLATARLTLRPYAPEHLRALIEGVPQFEEASGLRAAEGLREFMVSDEVSPAWLDQLRASRETDPWTHGFAVVHRDEEAVIGSAAFKGASGGGGRRPDRLRDRRVSSRPGLRDRGGLGARRVRLRQRPRPARPGAHPAGAERLHAGPREVRLPPRRRRDRPRGRPRVALGTQSRVRLNVRSILRKESMMKSRFDPLALCLAVFAVGSAWADGPADPARNAYPATQDPLGESVAKVVYLAQNWSPAESLKFYFTPQGSQILPYDWFLALEQTDSTTPFRDNKNILRLRYLAQNPGPMNPDGLPVGFTKDPGVGRNWLGLTCAACHTTEIRLGTTAYRVDGAPTHGDIQAFFNDLTCALSRTSSDGAKFDRFARAVLKGNDSPANRADLQTQLALVIDSRAGYNLRNFAGYNIQAPSPPPATRYGRLDAVDAIVNEVFHHVVKAQDLSGPSVNAILADAPVSYPCLWDTPQHDFVEWLGVAKSGGPLDIFSLSRNVGEVLGVFGDFSIPERSPLIPTGYASSVNFDNLAKLDNSLKTLWSPLWPSDFPAIDKAAAAEGSKLYQANCLQCHVLIDRADPRRKVVAWIGGTGTDTRAFDNFFRRQDSAGKVAGENVTFVPFTPKVPAFTGSDTILSHVVIGTILGKLKEAPPDYLDQIHFRGTHASMTAAVAVGAKYKARSLNGVWATAPYLHNGSVPTLDALLRPADERPKSFSIGVRTYDPVRVGYQTEVVGFPRFNVVDPAGSPILGNSNAGHEYGGRLTDVQRKQLIEYLKTL